MNPLNLTEIQDYLKKQLEIDDITVIDDSHLHTHHRSYQHQKAYLRIQLPKQPIPRLALHRKVMTLAQSICNQPIHAIQIDCL